MHATSIRATLEGLDPTLVKVLLGALGGWFVLGTIVGIVFGHMVRLAYADEEEQA